MIDPPTSPYDHLICQTPPFRLLLGITEYCFKDKDLLNESIHTACFDKGIRSDDLEFVESVKGWRDVICLKSMDGYEKLFTDTKMYFDHRLEDAKIASDKLIRLLE